MNKIQILLVFALLLGFNSYGQQDTVFIRHDSDWSDEKLNYTTDTIVFSTGMVRHVLTGTTVLPTTHNQQAAKEYGLYFTRVEKSDCKEEKGKYAGDEAAKINSIIATDSSLIIDFNIADNCCYSFLCDISVDSTDILHLLYTGYGSYCFCDCCFGLTYYIELMKGVDIPKIKAVMIENARNTIKSVKL